MATPSEKAEFLNACLKGREALVRRMLCASADPAALLRATDDRKVGALYLAVASRCAATLRTLLAAGTCDVDLPNGYHCVTPLELACDKRLTAQAVDLLNHGARITLRCLRSATSSDLALRMVAECPPDALCDVMAEDERTLCAALLGRDDPRITSVLDTRLREVGDTALKQRALDAALLEVCSDMACPMRAPVPPRDACLERLRWLLDRGSNPNAKPPPSSYMSRPLNSLVRATGGALREHAQLLLAHGARLDTSVLSDAATADIACDLLAVCDDEALWPINEPRQPCADLLRFYDEPRVMAALNKRLALAFGEGCRGRGSASRQAVLDAVLRALCDRPHVIEPSALRWVLAKGATPAGAIPLLRTLYAGGSTEYIRVLLQYGAHLDSVGQSQFRKACGSAERAHAVFWPMVGACRLLCKRLTAAACDDEQLGTLATLPPDIRRVIAGL
jgi:hypothetical protein